MELPKKPSVVQQNNSKKGMLWEIAVAARKSETPVQKP
jgi:hypothetical protein